METDAFLVLGAWVSYFSLRNKKILDLSKSEVKSLNRNCTHKVYLIVKESNKKNHQIHLKIIEDVKLKY